MGYNLQQRLDAFVSGECSLDVFVQELFVLCDETPESVWDALSLIDQYYRRGKLSADLFRTVRYRIERHVLGVPDSDKIGERPHAPTTTEASVAAVRDVAAAMPERAASPRGLASEDRVPRINLPDARSGVQRVRNRRAILVDLGQRTRGALANTQRRLGLWYSQARTYCERLMSREWHRLVCGQITGETGASATRDHRGLWRPVRPFRAGIFAAVLLGVAVWPVLQHLLRHRDTGSRALPSAAAVVTPQISDPEQISLSADRYVVLPGNVSADIQVRRSGSASGDVSFVWWTQSSRGAKADRDYVLRTPETAHLLDGVDTVRLSVPILSNPRRRHTELFYVVIDKPGGGASLGSIRRAAIFIMGPG
jgi:hypothetical protein